jgi:BirA family biotin operon repressor/biotin-[acetyl-CoA-carboxylase] ligase
MEDFRIYKTLDSTNKEAARLLASGQSLHGTAILAFHQTDGRGQYGRSWYAAPETHLAMSVILQPNKMLLGDLPPLAMKTSLAVVRSIRLIEPDLHPLIKWPNDIYVNSRKLAGILIENSISASRVQYSVIGIGMNVNVENFPVDIPNPVSLFLLTGKTYDIKSIAGLIRNQIMEIAEKPASSWKPEYDQLIYQVGEKHGFEINGKKFLARILGVDEEGRIELDTNKDAPEKFYSHEINWLL